MLKSLPEEKLVSLIQYVAENRRNQVHPYGDVSLVFTTRNIFRQDRSLSTFPINFVAETIMEIALSLSENRDIDIRSNRNLCEFEFADDVSLVSEDPSKLQDFLYIPNDNTALFGTYFYLLSINCCRRTRLAESRELILKRNIWVRRTDLAT